MAQLIDVSTNTDNVRIFDLVFIHGLEGNFTETWRSSEHTTSWLDWLAEEHLDVRILTVDYDISSTKFSSKSTQPLYDRAKNILDLFALHRIGERPFGFVCHSYGGLLAKQILRTGCDSLSSEYKRISEKLAFAIFLGTPHRGSSVATWISRVGGLVASTALRELRSDSNALRELNEWFRNYVSVNSLSVFSYSESKPTMGVVIVSIDDTDLGIPSAPSIGLDEDHISISKPRSRSDQVYLRVAKLIFEKKNITDSLRT